MERIRSLSLYQKAVLLVMAAMTLVFTVLYAVTTVRVGFAYQDAILVPSREEGGTAYVGKLDGRQAKFTVTDDHTVYFQHGETSYGPYTARRDETAVPKDSDLAGHMTGVELREGEEILFRGGVTELGDGLWLEGEDGSGWGMEIVIEIGGVTRDADGNVLDPYAPSAYTILELMGTPELTHKGDWLAWFFGVCICALCAVSILYADELFYLRLSLRVRDAESAEPAEWELASRVIGWAAMPLGALAIYILGLG